MGSINACCMLVHYDAQPPLPTSRVLPGTCRVLYTVRTVKSFRGTIVVGPHVIRDGYTASRAAKSASTSTDTVVLQVHLDIGVHACYDMWAPSTSWLFFFRSLAPNRRNVPILALRNLNIFRIPGPSWDCASSCTHRLSRKSVCGWVNVHGAPNVKRASIKKGRAP